MAKRDLQRDKGVTSGQSHDERVKKLRQKDNRPNILLLITDQQRYDTIAAGGADFMKTPNLDRLVREGCLYRNAYSPNPICMPARHNLLTGLTARVHGYPDNCWGFAMPSWIPTFPRLLSDHGYETHTIGKNHFYPLRRHHGYERMELMTEVPAYREQDDYAMYLKHNGLGHIHNIHGVRNLLYMVPQRSLIPFEHHGTNWVGDRAVQFIRNNRGRHPFLLKVSWIAPHPPFDVPDEYAETYRSITLPQPFRSETPISNHAVESRFLGDLPGTQYVRRMRELYYAAISLVDYNVGKILDALEDVGQLDNTLVFFFSDHGEMLGDYGTYQKWLPYDSCSRIPFVMRFPAQVEPGIVRDDFMDLNDVFPTILDASGIKYPEPSRLPGESLLQVNGKKDRSVQYMEYSAGPRRWVSLRSRDYKYNYYYGGGREELFHLAEDSHETVNLLESEREPGNREVKNELRAKLIGYERQWGLEGYVENDDPAILEAFVPRPYRNRAFPIFHEKITDPEEKGSMNSFFDEVLKAIEKEPVVRLEDLDLTAWRANGGFSENQIQELLQRERAMRGG